MYTAWLPGWCDSSSRVMASHSSTVCGFVSWIAALEVLAPVQHHAAIHRDHFVDAVAEDEAAVEGRDGDAVERQQLAVEVRDG
jgi:hypothetical protein